MTSADRVKDSEKVVSFGSYILNRQWFVTLRFQSLLVLSPLLSSVVGKLVVGGTKGLRVCVGTLLTLVCVVW